MFESGATIYFRHTLNSRALKGEVIGYTDGMYQIKGMRSSKQYTRPVYLIPADNVFAVAEIGRNKPKKNKLQRTGVGLEVHVDISLQRKVTMQARGITEMKIFTAPAFVALQKRVVRSLASKNHMPAHSMEVSELHSEFLCATLNAVRTICSKASDKELAEFKAFLSGSDDTAAFFCRIVLNLARTGKTACIRYLQRRKDYYQNHVNLDALERRVAA